MRLYIAICDDNESDLDALFSHLTSVCNELGITHQIDVFTDGSDFLASPYLKEYNMVFLDIYLKDLNGVDVVRDARTEISKTCHFVFTTISREHAIEAFNLNALHYLTKPLTQTQVKEAVERCIRIYSDEDPKVLEIKTGRKRIPIPMDSIVYIEVSNTLCTIHTEHGDYQTYSSLNTLFGLLDKALFIRAQKSFVVNMRFIDSFFYDHVVLRDGTEISLSRNNCAELKKQYQDFLFRYVRRGGR